MGMTFHEFGASDALVLVLFHPLGVWWDTFEYVVPTLSERYRVVIPAMPGHDPEQPATHYTSVEQVADEAADWLIAHGHTRVRCLYGCSMGGAVVTRLLALGRVQPDCAVIDGGITPYRLPQPLPVLICVRDFIMTELGKHLSLSALRGVFDPDRYSQADIEYIHKVLRFMSPRTIWRGFYSANNYAMPHPVPPLRCRAQYWYGEREKKERKWDIEYIQSAFPTIEVVEQAEQGHAEGFALYPELFCQRLIAFIEAGNSV